MFRRWPNKWRSYKGLACSKRRARATSLTLLTRNSPRLLLLVSHEFSVSTFPRINICPLASPRDSQVKAYRLVRYIIQTRKKNSSTRAAPICSDETDSLYRHCKYDEIYVSNSLVFPFTRTNP